MMFDNRLATLIFAHVFRSCITLADGSSEIAYHQLIDALPGTKVGRMTVVDVSQYSAAFLTKKSTQVIVDVGDEMNYCLELEEPAVGNKTFDEARNEIGETAERKAEAVNELIRKLDGMTDLSTPTYNNAWLVRFLRARNYDVSKTIDLIKRYYKFKEEHEEVYNELIPSKEKDVFAEDIITVLAPRDKQGRRIIIAKGGLWDGTYEQTVKVCRMTVAFLEIGVYEPASQLAGIQFVLDMKDMGYEQFKKISKDSITTMIDWIMNCVPLKLQGVHVVNKPWWFNMANKTVLRFVLGEMKKIFFVHNDFKSLHKMINVEALPSTYGGKYKMYEITQDEWEVFLKYQDKEYEELTSYGFGRPKKVQSSVKSTNNISRENVRHYARPLGMMETDMSRSQPVSAA